VTKPARRALWILAPSMVVVAAYHLAVAVFPSHWGGPNIGGGLILLLAYIGVAAGLVDLAIAWRQRSQNWR
jgi:F0F1-type ATP synthase assembly protein I